MSKPTKELMCTAHHEAGHAIAAHFQDIRFRHATIKPNESKNSLGHVLFKGLSKSIFTALDYGEISPTKRAHIEKYIICDFAGGIAERKHRGRYNHIGRTKDMENAMDLALAISGNRQETEAFLNWLHHRAINLIDKYWWAVEDVAQALLASTHLTEAEVKQVIYDGSARQLPPLPPIKFLSKESDDNT